MEPYEWSEELEAEWDRNCEAAPHCSCCGRSVYPDDQFLDYEGLILCERCVAENTRQTTELEVW